MRLALARRSRLWPQDSKSGNSQRFHRPAFAAFNYHLSISMSMFTFCCQDDAIDRVGSLIEGVCHVEGDPGPVTSACGGIWKGDRQVGMRGCSAGGRHREGGGCQLHARNNSWSVRWRDGTVKPSVGSIAANVLGVVGWRSGHDLGCHQSMSMGMSWSHARMGTTWIAMSCLLLCQQ